MLDSSARLGYDGVRSGPYRSGGDNTSCAGVEVGYWGSGVAWSAQVGTWALCGGAQEQRRRWRRRFSAGQQRREDDGVGRDKHGKLFGDLGLAVARVKSNGER